MHLGLVGGFVFFAVRGGLALIPWLALRYPIKKITAVVTLVVLFCYLMISGAAIPTQRAFVMTGIVFAAILIDRLRLSMRICAIAAAVVLVLDPASLVGVSFQMSFGAVVALVAVYETWGGRLAYLFHSGSFARKVLGYFGAVAITTLVATFGTEPFAIYHFHHVVLYSPLANVIAVPISAMWTLPWGVVACLLMPFGLEKLALVPMGWGIDLTILVAQWVATLPGNVWSMPRLPTSGAVLVALGGCWLCLWQGRWRVWGTVGIAAGLATMLFTRPPDLILGDFGRFVAARTADGNYFVTDTTEKLSRSFLVQETGATLVPWPAGRAAAAVPAGVPGGLECTEAGRCLYTAHGKEGGRGDRRVRAPGGLQHGRRDRRAGRGGVPMPVADPGGRPLRQLAAGRDRAVARSGGITVGRTVGRATGAKRRGDRPWETPARDPGQKKEKTLHRKGREGYAKVAEVYSSGAKRPINFRFACTPRIYWCAVTSPSRPLRILRVLCGEASHPSSGKPVDIRQCSRMKRPRSGRRRSRAKRSRAPVIASGWRSAPVGRYWMRLSRKPRRVT